MSKTVAGFVVSYPFFKPLSERMIRKNKAPSEKPMELSHIQETSPANFLPQNIPAMQQAQLTARLVGLDFSDFHFSSANSDLPGLLSSDFIYSEKLEFI